MLKSPRAAVLCAQVLHFLGPDAVEKSFAQFHRCLAPGGKLVALACAHYTIMNHVDPARMAAIEIDLMALEMTNLRVLADVQAGGAPGAESSILKIKGTEIRQAITDLARRALGPHALPFQPEALDGGFNGEPVGPDYAAPVAAHYFNMRKLSIFGGSNEIQKNIIAKASLGL